MNNRNIPGDWTKEEDDFLVQNFLTLGQSEIARCLKRRRGNVRQRANELGLPNKGEARPWTKEDLNFFTENYGVLSPDEIAKHLDRTKLSLKALARKLRLTKKGGVYWTPEEDEFLRGTYGQMPITVIAQHLSRTEKSVDGRANRLKITEKANRWTPEEEAFLAENYKKMSQLELVAKMNRSWSAISSKAHLMHLTESPLKAKKRWEEWEIDVLKCYCHAMSPEAIAEILPNRSAKVIRDKLVAMKLVNFTPWHEWSETEIEFVREAYLTSTFEEISLNLLKNFGKLRDVNSIGKIARSLGLRKIEWYSANNSFFKTPNLLNSYWGGFIAADGCVDDNQAECKSLKIDLYIGEIEHLERFISDSEFTGGINYPSRGGSALVRISCSQQWFTDLERNFSITPRKSKKPIENNTQAETPLQPPKGLDFQCSLAYITGLIDGDGSICITSFKGRMWLNITTVGSLPVLSWMSEIVDTLVEVSRTGKKAKVQRKGSIYGYSLGNRRAEALCKVLLSLQVPKLHRK